jgi:hypothetical protein
MRDGRILFHGTPETVLSRGWIATVYGLEDISVVPHPESGRPVVLPPAARPRSLNDDAFPMSSPRQADPSLVR